MNPLWLSLGFLGSLVHAAPVDYARDIAPMLQAKCAACHAGKTKTSDFSVEDAAAVMRGGKRYGKAVIGGHPEASPLLKMIKGQMQPRMPLGSAMEASEIARVEDWIRSLPSEQTAKKMEWRWPYEKPVKPALPVVKGAAWGRNPVDAFVLARLEKSSLGPAPEADRRVLARRVYYDLIGLPPAPEDVQWFVEDADPQAYDKLVDRLLADPRYGERWGRHWLDLVRYGETSGLEGDGAIGNAWRYRDWVISAFNQNMPYDQFVLAQLAGADENSKSRNNYQPNVQGHVPLGFLRLAPWDRSNLVADEVRANYLAEITATTGSVFLGLSVGCARCHDHKYDPISQKDYYRFQAFFQSIQVEDVSVPFKDPELKKRADEAVRTITARLKDGPERAELNRIEPDALKRLIATRKEQAQGKEITKDDLRLEMRRLDKSLFSQEDRLKHADLLEDANRTQDPEEKNALETYEADALSRLKRMYATAADPLARFDVLTVEDVRTELGRNASKVFTKAERDRFKELTEQLDVLNRRLRRWQPMALTVKNVPGPPNGPAMAPIRVLARGDYRQPGEAVEAGFLTCIDGKDQAATIVQDRYRQYPTRGFRMTLAKWIASAENPLTARVMVNRIWQHHFGRGIVGTASDFGVNGERPTHPELLDWLAHRFVESGWDVKAMHRLMLTSAAYRQSAENARFAANTADPENKLLWRFQRRRLEAEEIRDSVLSLSGRLNPEQFGPSVFPPLPADLADFARYGRGGGIMWEPNEKDADARRRSVYIFHRRSLPLPMMAAFDAPVFSESCDRRSSTTTPLQALSMMNGNLVQEEAVHLVARVAQDAGADRVAKVTRAFEYVLQRKPTSDEAAHLAKYSGDLASVCRVLLNSNEFLYLD
ncbi:MAG: PSD1 domain-containing protein [Acidobacteria bacterium]|nr:PSD1 domain-containing protein [Acidobacteriota bacterium]